MKMVEMCKKGFTLIEMLIVIGIIAILSGVMLVSFNGSSESAKAAKCLANMRALAQGANNYAMESGIYPLASSVQRVDMYVDRAAYYEIRGWISWLSNDGDPFGTRNGGKPPSNPVNCRLPTYDLDPLSEDAIYAITNGTMFKAVNKNYEVYRCPAHVKRYQKTHNDRSPVWSYVMNSYFGYDYSQGTAAVGWANRKEFDRLPRADRIVMFAELPDLETGTGERSGSGEAVKDATLQYSASYNGRNYGKNWKGTPEAMGFTHKHGKKGSCAHVVFADGHVEKFIRGEGLELEVLTALLCEGRDVVFDGKKYDEVKETE